MSKLTITSLSRRTTSGRPPSAVPTITSSLCRRGKAKMRVENGKFSEEAPDISANSSESFFEVITARTVPSATAGARLSRTGRGRRMGRPRSLKSEIFTLSSIGKLLHSPSRHQVLVSPRAKQSLAKLPGMPTGEQQWGVLLGEGEVYGS